MKILLKITSVLVLLPTIAALLFFGQIVLMEGYNPFNPYLDTQFAENYSPKKFDNIKIGMTKNEVFESIGNPLFKSDYTYDYTNDGKFAKGKFNDIVGDYAWYRSSIKFDKNDVVIFIDKGWSFD